MGCPQCQSDELSPTGECPVCGYRPGNEASEEKPETEAQDPEEPSGLIEVNYSSSVEDTPEKTEIPLWRQQLSQRLHEIKQRKETVEAVSLENKSSPAPVSQAKTPETLSSLQARLRRVPVRKPPAPFVPPPRQRALQPLEPKPEPKEEVPPPAEPQTIRNLIDSAVSRQVPQNDAWLGAPLRPEPVPAPDAEGKLILMSRTLSGLVDLIIIVFCTGASIVAADYFSGIIGLDGISLTLFLLLFLLNFFLYSMFFLTASNQTIGMMITDLRVVDEDDRRPSPGRLLRRCGAYLLSVFILGLGLLSALFDRKSLCFHDRVSGTHIRRT